MKIAIAGMGGSGKTTIAGTFARALARRSLSVLAIDGDTNPNLAISIGIPRDTLANISGSDVGPRVGDPTSAHPGE